jgi:hypothetical protein
VAVAGPTIGLRWAPLRGAGPAGCRFRLKIPRTPSDEPPSSNPVAANARRRVDLPLRLPCPQAGPPADLKTGALKTCGRLARSPPGALNALARGVPPRSRSRPRAGRLVRSSTSRPESPRSPRPRPSGSRGMGRDESLRSAASRGMGWDAGPQRDASCGMGRDESLRSAAPRGMGRDEPSKLVRLSPNDPGRLVPTSSGHF